MGLVNNAHLSLISASMRLNKVVKTVSVGLLCHSRLASYWFAIENIVVTKRFIINIRISKVNLEWYIFKQLKEHLFEDEGSLTLPSTFEPLDECELTLQSALYWVDFSKHKSKKPPFLILLRETFL